MAPSNLAVESENILLASTFSFCSIILLKVSLRFSLLFESLVELILVEVINGIAPLSVKFIFLRETLFCSEVSKAVYLGF